ncbi:MAG: universal stress protein [Deltaproteobacteria bacterium]|nr:MAG: universal stress protein [Deltaproteobacteria bacterium]
MFHRILIPTDYSDTSRRALEVGLRLAKLFEATVVCLHAPEELTHGQFSASHIAGVSDVIDEDEEKLRQYARDRLTQLVTSGTPGIRLADIAFRVASGTPSEVIVQTAEELACDLIVIGTHGRSGITDKLLGSTADRVARRATCSVMTVKPEGYPYLRGA